MPEHVFTGFGFGPIQSGLFAKEAFQSGNFSRIIVAEIDAQLVDAVRANAGSYHVNVAGADGMEMVKIDNVELLNPTVPADKRALLEALARSTEIATCLPSVNFYESGGPESVASWIAEGLKNSTARATVIYTAENNNHAAQILQKAVARESGGALPGNVQFLNTVIGKMSRTVTDSAEIVESKLWTIAPGLERAFLVEQFNRILVSRIRLANFRSGIGVFIEKDDLLPFEEAKLYGHNAIHSVLGFLGALKGRISMTELKADKTIMRVGRDAFLNESGAALVKTYSRLGDELFTEAGFRDYAEDLLKRMTNPYLGDTIARVTRDVVRKLEIDGRIFGTMQLALEHGIEPRNMALGALAGVGLLLQKAQEYNLSEDLRFGDWRQLNEAQIKRILNWVWRGETSEYRDELIEYLRQAQRPLDALIRS
jgi:mannitol-1-phosphate 5-dehydrogenase